MKKPDDSKLEICQHSRSPQGSVSTGTTHAKIGRVTIIRSTHAGKDGKMLVLAVASASRTKLARETTKQIRAIVANPISGEQQSKADQLAKRAKDAHASAATAKFRRLPA